MMSSSLRRMFSQRRNKKASTTREADTEEVVAEVADVDVVGTLTTIAATKEEEAQKRSWKRMLKLEV